MITKFCLQLLLIIHDDNSFIFFVNPGLFSRVGVAELNVVKIRIMTFQKSFAPQVFHQISLTLPASARDSLVWFIWSNVDQLVPHWLPEFYQYKMESECFDFVKVKVLEWYWNIEIDFDWMLISSAHPALKIKVLEWSISSQFLNILLQISVLDSKADVT